jgi:hypothetical protein
MREIVDLRGVDAGDLPRRQQRVERLAVDRVHRHPRRLAAIDPVHPGPVRRFPVVEELHPVDGETVARAERLELGEDARAPVDDGAVRVERERADHARARPGAGAR